MRQHDAMPETQQPQRGPSELRPTGTHLANVSAGSTPAPAADTDGVEDANSAMQGTGREVQGSSASEAALASSHVSTSRRTDPARGAVFQSCVRAPVSTRSPTAARLPRVGAWVNNSARSPAPERTSVEET